MRVAIVHYHLKPGGVTRVVENALIALGDAVDGVVISGEPYQGNALEKTAVVAELQYTGEDEKPDVSALVDDLRKVAKEALQGEPDVWHIHNHALGKNSAMPEVVEALAARGAALLLQIHDFAEDGRPGNFAYIHKHLKPGVSLYPISERIHYAGLNGRDIEFLSELGVPKSNLHLLPNPVTAFAPFEGDVRIDGLACEYLYIYPTRAIRRKNMGEFVLAAASAIEGELFASTLAPANPAALPIYERWVSFAQNQGVQARFGIAEAFDFTFGEIMSAADAVMTTSVAEGFGLAFLEPWLMNKPLLGRNLSEITADFVQHGIQLDSLYQSLDVPLEWVDLESLKRALSVELANSYRQYGREKPTGAEQQAFDAMMVQPNTIDFGRLNEPLQEGVIEKVVQSQALREQVRSQILRHPASIDTIANNRRLIEQTYSMQSYGIQLKKIYEEVVAGAQAPLESLDGEILLNCFLAPARFCLLRS